MFKLIFGVLLFYFIAPFIGHDIISLQALKDPTISQIFWDIRVPRTLYAIFAGGALAVSGVIFQNIFKNVLADSYILGPSTGASLALVIGNIFFAGTIFYEFMPLIGSLGVMAILLIMMMGKKNMNSQKILLLGISLNFIFGSLVTALIVSFDGFQTLKLIRWTMGSLDIIGTDGLLRFCSLSSILTILVWLTFSQMNTYLLGNDLATAKGLKIRKYLYQMIILGSLLVTLVVAELGPIGFVGLIAPHVVRILMGNNHKKLIPLSFLLGGWFLVFADVISRIFSENFTMPLGVVTSLIGAPIFIYLIFRKSNYSVG
jgi:iron complex transport system permease protein